MWFSLFMNVSFFLCFAVVISLLCLFQSSFELPSTLMIWYWLLNTPRSTMMLPNALHFLSILDWFYSVAPCRVTSATPVTIYRLLHQCILCWSGVNFPHSKSWKWHIVENRVYATERCGEWRRTKAMKKYDWLTQLCKPSKIVASRWEIFCQQNKKKTTKKTGNFRLLGQTYSRPLQN